MNKMSSIIYFPFFKGQYFKESPKTYNMLNKSLNMDIRKYNMKNNYNSSIYSDLYSFYSFLHKNKYNKIIGGDHSISIATLQYSMAINNNTKVLWFDAHPDINTMEKSSSKNVHGMPLAVATGLENKYSFVKNILPFKNILYVGIRSIDTFEKEIIEKNNIQHISVDEIKNNPILALEKIKKFVSNNNIHLSVDVDCLEPKLIPSTGTPVENGLDLKDIYNLITPIKNKVIFTECVEFNPSIYDKPSDIETSLKTFNSISKIIF